MEDKKVGEAIALLKASDANVVVSFGRSKVDPDLLRFHIFDKLGPAKGFGAAFSLGEAFAKASSEYFERRQLFMVSSIDKTRLSSSGFAAHIDAAKARAHALAEVIEREALLLAWMAKKAPCWLPEALLQQLAPQFSRPLFDDHGSHLQVGILAKCSDVYVAVSCVSFETEASGHIRFAIDTAAGHDLSALVQSVYIGALVRLESYLFAERIPDTETASPLGHFFLHADQGSQSSWFIKGDQEIFELAEPAHGFEEWVLSSPLGDRFIAYCNALAQRYFVGETTDEKINFARLFAHFPELDRSDINKEIHPLP